MKQAVRNPFSGQLAIAMKFKDELARTKFVSRYGMYVEKFDGDYVYIMGHFWRYVMKKISEPFGI